MKNARHYEKKTRRLLARLRKGWSESPSAPDHTDRIGLLVRAVLEYDSTAKQVEQALSFLEKEFVDFNELRVGPTKEIAECIGRGDRAAREKAAMLSTVLNGIYSATNRVSLDYLEDKTKRDLRRRLLELGLNPYAAASVTLLGFDGHAVPVDQTLVDCLEMDGYIYPGSDLADVQGFLERIVPQKDAPMVHELFRGYVEKSAKRLAKRRKAAAKRAEAEKARKAEAAKVRRRARAKKKAARKRATRKTAAAAAKKPARAEKKSVSTVKKAKK